MKKLTTCMLGVMFALSLMVVPAWADSKPYVQDNYGLFDASTTQSLESEAQALQSQYGVAPYFVTVDNIGTDTVRNYAEQYYWNELGLGPDDDVVLFLVSVDDRWYVTITRGDGIYYFSDYGIQYLEDRVTSYLADNDWVGAAYNYYDACDYLLSYAQSSGAPYDVNNQPKGSPLIPLAAAIVIGLVVALIVIGSMKRQMKSAKENSSAAGYLKQGTFNLLNSNDRFITTTVSKTAIPKHESSGGGGGSSVSSSGFGGSSGGRF